MYQKILVPLDGSALAECVLPHVETIAKGCGVSSVVFVRAAVPSTIPLSGDFSVTFTEDDIKRIDLENKASAEKYLNEVASRSTFNGVKVQTKVVIGQAADVIADYASKNDISLIVIATHGRSGVSRWAWGSVADKLLRTACVPVLMVRAPGCIAGM